MFSRVFWAWIAALALAGLYGCLDGVSRHLRESPYPAYQTPPAPEPRAQPERAQRAYDARPHMAEPATDSRRSERQRGAVAGSGAGPAMAGPAQLPPLFATVLADTTHNTEDLSRCVVHV